MAQSPMFKYLVTDSTHPVAAIWLMLVWIAIFIAYESEVGTK